MYSVSRICRGLNLRFFSMNGALAVGRCMRIIEPCASASEVSCRSPFPRSAHDARAELDAST